MSDTALGSALVIPAGLLEDLAKMDKELENIQKSANGATTAMNGFSASVQSLNSHIMPAISSLGDLAAKLQEVGSSATAMAASVNNSGNLNVSLSETTAKAETLRGSITKTSEEIEKLSGKKVVTFDSALSSANDATSIKQRTDAIKELIQVRDNLSKTDSDYASKMQTLNNAIAKLSEENKKAVMTNEQLANSEEKLALEAQRRASAQTRANAATLSSQAALINAQTRLSNAQARANTGRVTTDPGEAMQQARLAKSINERTAAIKSLTAARNNLSTSDKNYASTLDMLNSKIKELTKLNKEAVASSKLLSDNYNSLGAIAERMGKRLLLAFSLDTMKNFMSELVEVRANFEMQQRSLEAILQDKTAADEIFNKTVQLAVKSPFKIQELVTYTKQLAAYRIESDQLYDTTKRLADVSAGLGVDMQRLILAYGQVKAAAYLRGTEVRQFTEAGVNMYGELQKYFQEVKGEAYTTAQIVDMISKRKVTFEDVEQVFKRLTDEGGIFYNMQEIQSQTLQGKISNLADSWDIMMNEMGKSNQGLLTGAVDTSRYLLQNWEKILDAGKALAAVFALLWVESRRTGVSMKAMFKTDMLTNARNLSGTFSGLGAAFQKAGAAAVTFGRNLLAAFMDNVATIAILAIVKAIWDFVGAIYDLKEAYNDVNKAHADQENEINRLIKKYNDLKIAQTQGSKVDDAPTQQLKDRQNALQGIIDEVEKMGVDETSLFKSLNITTPVESMDTAQIETNFRKIQEYAQGLNNTIQDVGLAYASASTRIEGWFNIFGTNIVTDANNLKEAESDAIGHASQMGTILNDIGAHYNSLSAEAKKYYDTIKDGQDFKNGESQIQYLERLRDAYVKISQAEGKAGHTTYGNQLYGQLQDVGIDWSDLSSQEQEFMQELERMKKDIHESNPIKLKAAIDKQAVDASWSDNEKALAYKVFHLKAVIDVDTDTAKDGIDYVQQYLQDLQDSGKFTIDVTTEIDTKGLEGWMKTGKNAVKAAKEFKEQYDAVSKGMANSGETTLKATTDVIKVLKEYNPFSTVKEGDLVDKKTIRAALKGLQNEYTNLAKDFGFDPFETKKKKKKSTVVDYYSLQIEALEKMQQRYQGLIKYMGQNDAGEMVQKQFAATLQYVKMPEDIILSYIPQTKEALADAIDKIIPKIKDVKKKADAMLKVQQLRIEIRQEELKKSLEEAKDVIDRYFDNLDLNIKLKDLGLNQAEISDMFGPLEENLDDIKSEIEDVFTARYEKIFGKSRNEWDTDQSNEFVKAYDDAMKKVDQKIAEQNIKTFEELTKNYKSQMEEQLKTDMWYIDERAKIMSNPQLNGNKALQDSYLMNLENQYSKKTDENKWTSFQNSDYYITMFDSMESRSTKALKNIKAKLEEMRTSLKNLSPEQLKQIVTQEEKLDEVINKRNPFKSLTDNLKTYIEYLKNRKEWEEKLANYNTQIESKQNDISTQAKSVKLAEQRFDFAQKLYGFGSQEARAAKSQLKTEQMKLTTLQSETNTLKMQSSATETLLHQGLQAGDNVKASFSEISEGVNAVVNGIQEIGDAAGGLDKDTTDILNILVAIGAMVEAIESGGFMAIVTAVVMMAKALIGMFNNDSELQEQIEKMERSLKKLTYAYDNLKEAMDNAWNDKNLIEYKNETIDNLKAQITLYGNMIATEKEKKKTDEDQILTWQQSIKDAQATIKELEETALEAMGGFGSQSNYKSAAQEFADAWVDAFNESSDTLEALEDTFDDYFNNLLKKQIMNIASKNFLQRVLSKFDSIVAEGSEGGGNGTEITANEVKELKELKDSSLAAYNSYVSNMMSALGISASGTSSSLSALQQGIQSVSETTAEALESILNSMRFTLASQSTEVSTIKSLILNVVGEPSGGNTIIKELQQQTTLLQDIHDLFSSVTTNITSKGRCLKVYN